LWLLLVDRRGAGLADARSRERKRRRFVWAYVFSGLACETGGTTRIRVAKSRAATVRERFPGSLDLINEAKSTRNTFVWAGARWWFDRLALKTDDPSLGRAVGAGSGIVEKGMQSVIRCEALHKRYAQRRKDPVDAVRRLDLEVRAGECFGLLGPNGAGKTTTVEILEGLLAPTSGLVEVLGMRWGRDDRRIRPRIGISLQETRLADKLTAIETVRLFRSFYPKGAQPDALLAELDLQPKRGSFVEHLSGGQRQRLAVACALVGAPDLLFLDEPTTGLDPQARRGIWDVITAQRDRGCTVMLTTHYMDEAQRLCDRVAIVDHGRVIALGTPKELIASLQAAHVIEFALECGGDGFDVEALRGIDGLGDLRREGDEFVLTVAEPHVALPALLRRIESDGRVLARLTTRHASLEDVFVGLTGRHLSD
jgi:ABC-2 type transport system ATP-binding protein